MHHPFGVLGFWGFVDYGGNRHGFLSFAEIHPDYYQIPVADREALIAEEEAYAKTLEEEANLAQQKKSRIRKRKPKVIAEEADSDISISSDVIEKSDENVETQNVTENQDSSNPNSITDNEEVSDSPIDFMLTCAALMTRSKAPTSLSKRSKKQKETWKS